MKVQILQNNGHKIFALNIRMSIRERCFNCSRGHIDNLINAGAIPPPLVLNGIKLWPAKMIEAIDQEREKEYYKSFREQGFHVPDALRLFK